MSIQLTRKEFMQIKRLIINSLDSKTSALDKAEEKGWIINDVRICPMCQITVLKKNQSVCDACEFDARN